MVVIAYRVTGARHDGNADRRIRVHRTLAAGELLPFLGGVVASSLTGVSPN